MILVAVSDMARSVTRMVRLRHMHVCVCVCTEGVLCQDPFQSRAQVSATPVVRRERRIAVACRFGRHPSRHRLNGLRHVTRLDIAPP